jgi:hypothetical protein
MEVKITEIDARAKSAQHRLDNLERCWYHWTMYWRKY